MDLMHIPLCELSIAKTNVRHGVKKADFADLIPSIRQRGILQPLLVRKNGKGYEIVAGRRRYLAAQSLEKEGLEVEAIPCAIMAKGDDAAAVEASLIENVHRLPMDDMDQFETFPRLLKEGRTIEEIANTFGVTEIMVKRRLAIANLSLKIRTAYRAEEIDGETLRALTLASKQQQMDWLLLFEEPEQHAPRGGNLKRWLLGGSQIPTTNALFDLANYKGEIVSDLFGEESYFANADMFWTLQNEAIAKLKASLEAHGWSRVEIMEQDQRFHEWDYEKTPKKKGGAVYISISDRGEVEAHEGYLSRAEARKAEARAKGATEPEAKSAKPELTRPLQNYFNLHRHAAVRLELLNHPQVALRLAVAHMIAGSRLWLVKPEPQQADKPEIEVSLQQSKAQLAFAERRLAVLDLLGFDPNRVELVRPNGDDDQTVAVFAQLLKQRIALLGNIRLGKVDGPVRNRVMCLTVVGQGVVEKAAVKVLLPELSAPPLQPHDVVEAEFAHAAGNLLRRITLASLDQFVQALEEEAPVDEDGNLAGIHADLVEVMKPEMKKPQGFGTLSR